MLQEKVAKGWSGWGMVGVLLAALAGSIVMLRRRPTCRKRPG